MDNVNYFDKNGIIFALIVFVFSLLLFYYFSTEFFKSCFAAILAACLGWLSYVIIRWFILALRK